MCVDGCELVLDYVNDGVCDCAECEDEDPFTCETCREGCPADCGDTRSAKIKDSYTRIINSCYHFHFALGV
jgi:hypothetical protein